MSGSSHRAVVVALGANLAIAVAKSAAAFFTGSGAMLAEAVHSFADCGNQLLLLFGLRQAKRPPTPEHPLGHGKAVYFWSFLVAVMLFSVGGMFSVYEGVHKLQHPEPLTQWGWAVAILAFSLVAEGVSTRAALKEAAAERRGRTLWRWFRDSRQAELIVVIGENIAAMCGLAVALVAIGLSVVTHDPLWDALGTVLIGVLLIVVAVFVAIEIKAMLIGQSIDPVRQAEIRELIESQPGITGVLALVTQQLGNDVLVSAHVTMRGDVMLGEQVAVLDGLERELKRRYPEIVWSFFEPQVESDAGH
jgi:cation diffusion facilitator family transporter